MPIRGSDNRSAVRSGFKASLARCLWVALALWASWSAVPAAAQPYRVATVAWIGWSPLHVAEVKGFWAEQGLDVQVVNYDDPIVILEAIKAGRIEFAMDMAGSLVGVYQEGEPVVALAETNWSHGGDQIVVRRGTTLRQQVGRPLGVFLKLPSCLYFLGLHLRERGLRLDQFRIVEINPEDLSAQFAAGRLPAIVNYQPWVRRAAALPSARVAATSADYPGCIPECLWSYRRTLARVPERDVVGLLAGWIKAARWAAEAANREEYRAILNLRTFAGHRSLSPARLEAMLANVRIHQPAELWERNRDGGGLHAYLRDLRGFLRENGLLRRDYRPGDILDNRYLLRALGRTPGEGGGP
jgi:NitT/TauT family transport system substrate-binding protein